MQISIKNIIATLLITIAMTACNDTNSSIGIEVQDPRDNIIVSADTFIIQSADYYVPAISAQADSFIIGEYFSPKYGTTKSELLVQLAPPVDYAFPGSEYRPTPDSLVLLMYYNTWFGSPYAPIEMSIYEINKQSIDYNTHYLSNLNIDDFSDKSVLMGKRLATTIDLSRVDSLGNDTAETPYIRYKFDDTQLKRFFSIPQESYASEESFLEEFKGLYITTHYGTSTLVYLNQISLFLYYHYTYTRSGKDTVVNTSIHYPANKEVRQLHKFSHPDLAEVAQHHDSVNYIKSAAGIYPKITIPIGRIKQRVNEVVGEKEPHINGANIEVECTMPDTDHPYINPPSYIMAISTDKYDDFLRTNSVPTSIDTTTIVASYNAASNSYKLDFAYFIEKKLQNSETQPDDTVEMMLVPVTIETSNGSNITKIKPLAMLSAVTVRSGQNEHSPMRLKILYNGF